MKRPFRRFTPITQVQQVTVIEVTSLIGEGIEGDPVRNVVEYYSLDGVLLARRGDLRTGAWADDPPYSDEYMTLWRARREAERTAAGQGEP